MVLAQKHRPVKENRGPRYKATELQYLMFLQRCQKYRLEKRQHLQQIVLGELDFNMEKSEARSYLSPYIKLNSKWANGLNIRPDTLNL